MRISILDPWFSYLQRVSILCMYQMWFYRFSCCVWIAKCMYSVSSTWIHFAKSSHTGPYRLCIGYTIIYHSRILKSSYLFGPSLISCGRMNGEFISKWHCAGHPGAARCSDAIMRSTESWQKIPSFSVGRTFGNGGFSWIFYLSVGFVGAIQEIFSLLCCVPPALEPMSQTGTRCHPVCHTINRSGIVAAVEVWEDVFGSQGCRTKPVFLRVTHLNHVQFASPIWIPRASQDAFRPLYSSFEIAMCNWCLEIKNIELTKTNQPIFNVFQTSWHFMPFKPPTQTDIHSNAFFRPVCFFVLDFVVARHLNSRYQACGLRKSYISAPWWKFSASKTAHHQHLV